MLNWITILSNVVVDLFLVLALATGRIVPWGKGPRRVARRENPYFYWFFIALIAFMSVSAALTLAEQTIPGFHAPAFLG